eukprot:CAMPEP_0182597270 /NCGR_PEP_ID=MMETSP1324-20130603/85904_1 /TAXON_ID=236786 /ORGANISM="Florenciella sp., Strain RCC1587" /LENGTH=70 /DNA_ID=CAMNT_0024815007 /DNA_START=68 /DNA_END=280 /DNA_ORIENTATION=-
MSSAGLRGTGVCGVGDSAGTAAGGRLRKFAGEPTSNGGEVWVIGASAGSMPCAAPKSGRQSSPPGDGVRD